MATFTFRVSRSARIVAIWSTAKLLWIALTNGS